MSRLVQLEVETGASARLAQAKLERTAHRRTGSRKKMFLRLLLRATLVRRSRVAGALIAITVAAAVATTLLNIYGDAQAKLRADFRGYGANVIVLAKDGASLPLTTIEQAAGTTAVPYAYAVVRTADGLEGSPVVVAGTDFARARALNQWWSVTQWPHAPNVETGLAPSPVAALLGQRAARSLTNSHSAIALWFHGKKLTVTPAGILKTGGDEDSRIYIPLAAFQQWTGLGPSTLELRLPGPSESIKAAITRLQSALPNAEVRPVRQVVEAEAHVLGRTRSMLFWTTLAVIATSALCVFATLISWVLDRRRDFAVMKALGASEQLVMSFFAAEAAFIGALGAVFGIVLGTGAAEWIGRASFGANVAPQFNLMPLVLVGGIVLALAAAAGPLGILRRIQPATILRGE